MDVAVISNTSSDVPVHYHITLMAGWVFITGRYKAKLGEMWGKFTSILIKLKVIDKRNCLATNTHYTTISLLYETVY